MNSGTLNYQLQTFTGLVSHGWPKVAFLQDSAQIWQDDVKLGVDAQVRSGDYFVTLATKLDALSKDMNDYGIRADLEDLVSDLIYLQDNYTITKSQGLK